MTEHDHVSMDESAARSALSSLYPQAAKQLSLYVDILLDEGLTWGLLGPREGERVWTRHIANSIALVDAIPEGLRLADIGSGAGLPGIPVALVRPDLRVTLVEPLQRRAEFLQLAVRRLQIDDRVTVVRSRAEELAIEPNASALFDVVTCRAVAPLTKLLGWTANLFLPDGQLLALKGQSAEQEVTKASKILAKRRCSAESVELTLPHGLEGTRAVRVRRTQ